MEGGAGNKRYADGEEHFIGIHQRVELGGAMRVTPYGRQRYDFIANEHHCVPFCCQANC